MPGYDVSGGALPEDLLCVNCELLLREPVQTDKGEHYCLDCLPQEYCGNGSSNAQPVTQTDRWHRDVRIQRDIMKLRVKCGNAKYGCKWQGTVRNVQGHSDRCHHKDTELHTPTQVEEKLREFERRFEEYVQGTQSMISAVKDVTATLVQKIFTLRSELDISQNSKSSVHTPHAAISQPLPFEDPTTNEDLVTLHGEPMAEEVQVSDVHQDLPPRDAGNKKSMLHNSVEATCVADPDLELPEEEDVEQIFETGVEEGRAGLTKAGENEKILEQHELQRAGLTKEIGSLSAAAMSGGRLFLNERIWNTYHTTLKNHPFCNGRHGEYIWRISGVIKRRQEAQANPSTPLMSPPWYTDLNGYKLCTHLYLNGSGTQVGSHISVFLAVMKGELDPILQWPLRGRMSFFLLDLGQKYLPIAETRRSNPNSPSFQQPSPHRDMNIASGCPNFAPLSVLDDKRYVDDDEMFIKCIMDVHS